MRRRDLLLLSGAVAAGTMVGGSYLLMERGDDWGGEIPCPPPFVDDPPAAVYLPTHEDGMAMIGHETAGDYAIALSYTFPHPFWILDGHDTEFVDVDAEDPGVHLMASIWDHDTGTVLPVDTGPTIELLDDGEPVETTAMWPMLSQQMGYHFGENVSIEDGSYTIRVELPSMNATRTGSYEGRFEERETVEFEFEYARDVRDELPCIDIDDPGERGAIEPMAMDHVPISELPPVDDLPGTLIGEKESDDAHLPATVVEDPERFGAETYLAVSLRTPYNRYPLPNAALSAEVEGVEVALSPTLDDELGFHYGAEIDPVESGDEIVGSVETPPQISRHVGYETAFMEFSDVRYEVE